MRCIVAFCSVVLGLTSSLVAHAGSVKTVTAEYVINNELDAIVLDVRTEAEYQMGHIENAVNIDVSQASFKTRLAKLDPSKTYIVHCGANITNGRADNAISQMQESGLLNLESLEGGYLGWVKAGGKVIQP